MCRNHEVARRDAAIRTRLVEILTKRVTVSDTLTPTKRAELRGRLKEKPGLNRYLRVTKSGLLRIDKTKFNTEIALDGKYLLRNSDLSIAAEDIARDYKALAEAFRGWRDMKQLEFRPIYHAKSDRIVGHVQLCRSHAPGPSMLETIPQRLLLPSSTQHRYRRAPTFPST